MKKFIFKLDKKIFEQVQLIEETKIIKNFNFFLSQLDDKLQRVISLLTSLSICILPLLIASIFHFSNSSLKFEIETKDKILKTFNQISLKKNKLRLINSSLLSPDPATSKDRIKNKLNAVLPTMNIDNKNVTVEMHRTKKFIEKLRKIHVNLRFKNFSTKNLQDFFEKFLNQENYVTHNLSLKRDKLNKSLSGYIELYQFSRDSK